jgi:hypothetical protein
VIAKHGSTVRASWNQVEITQTATTVMLASDKWVCAPIVCLIQVKIWKALLGWGGSEDWVSGAEVVASSAGGVFSGAFSEFSVPDKDEVGTASVADGEFVGDSFMKASQRKNCGCGQNPSL